MLAAGASRLDHRSQSIACLARSSCCCNRIAERRSDAVAENGRRYPGQLREPPRRWCGSEPSRGAPCWREAGKRKRCSRYWWWQPDHDWWCVRRAVRALAIPAVPSSFPAESTRRSPRRVRRAEVAMIGRLGDDAHGDQRQNRAPQAEGTQTARASNGGGGRGSSGAALDRGLSIATAERHQRRVKQRKK